MIVEHPVSDTTATQLPSLSLQSMTQGQLEEFIPQLVTQVTGRTSPLFGTTQYRPDWWPHSVEWITPQQLTHKHQNPSETLREVVRSCYRYSEQEDLLNIADLPSFSEHLPLSPTVAESDMCAAEPATEQSNSMETEESPDETAAERQDNVEKCMSKDSLDNIQDTEPQELGENRIIDHIDVNNSADETETIMQYRTGNRLNEESGAEIIEDCENITFGNKQSPVSNVLFTVRDNDKAAEKYTVEIIDDSQEDEIETKQIAENSLQENITKNDSSVEIIDDSQEGANETVQQIAESYLQCGNKPDVGTSCLIIEDSQKNDVKVTSNIDNKVIKDDFVKVIEETHRSNKEMKTKPNNEAGSKTSQKSVETVNCKETSTEMTMGEISDELKSEIDNEILKSLQARFNFGELMNTPLERSGQKIKGQHGKKQTNKLFGKKTPINNEYLGVKLDGTIQICDDTDVKKEIKVRKRESSVEKNMLESHLDKKLTKPARIEDKAHVGTSTDLSANKVSSAPSAQKEEKQEDDVVWICFICAKGFANQNELMAHQDVCEEDSDIDDITPLKSCDPTPSETPSSQDIYPTHPLSERAVREHLLHSESPKQSLTSNENTGQPVPTLLRKVGSGIKTLPLGLPTESRIFKRRRFKDIYIPPSRDVYFESLGLGLTPKVEEISKSPRKSVGDNDCQIIDLTIEDSQAKHSSPMTPRTRFMMSQHSRDDGNGRRRQLSFSHAPPTVVENKVKPEAKLSSDSDSNEDSSEDEVVQRKSTPFKSALLGIPLTSPLGQRLKKHWENENKVPVISNAEEFCNTSNVAEICPVKPDKKNPMMEKLRHRPPPPITFRFTKKYINKWFHSYKFNYVDKREFQKRIRTGLERESRLRKKQMKPCKVELHRVSKKDIKYWTTPRPKQAPRFTPNLPQLQMRMNYKNQLRMSLNQQCQFVRNYMPQTQGRPMLLMNRPQGNFLLGMMPRNVSPGYPPRQMIIPQTGFVSGGRPTPQLLVRTVTGGNEGMRIEVCPIQNRQSAQHQSMPSASNSMLQRVIPRSQKRKQEFRNVRADDNMVICLSSDEENEPARQPPPCSACKVSKDACSIHGKRKIGPASFMRNQKAQKARRLSQSQTTSSSKSATNSENLVKTQNIGGGDSASSRVFGKAFQSTGTVHWRCQPGAAVQQSFPTVQSNPNLNSDRMTNGQIVFSNSAQDTGTVNIGSSVLMPVSASRISEPKTESIALDTSPPVASVQPESPTKSGPGSQSQSDSEYMDYEVICIDSDGED